MIAIIEKIFRDRLQISLLILSEFEQINKLLFPLNVKSKYQSEI